MLIVLLLAVLSTDARAQVELLKNLKLGGEIHLQTTSAQNTSDFSTHPNPAVPAANNDRVGSAQILVLLHADWDLLDDVHAKLTLGKNDRDWGTQGGNAHSGPALANQSQPIGTAGNNVLGSTFVDQAYVKIDKVFGAVDSTFGRQFYGTQGDIAAYFGPRVGILGMPVTALDAGRFDWTDETMAITGVVGKIAGSAVNATAANDTDLRGLLATYRFDDNTSAGGYVYDSVIHASGGSGASGVGSAAPTGINTNLWLAGLKGKLAWGPLVARAEVAKNFGEDRTGNVTTAGSTYTGWGGKLDAGVRADFEDLGSAAVWVQGAAGSGQGNATSKHNSQFTPIAGDYRAGGIYTRFNSISAVPLGGAATLASLGAIGSNSLGNRVIGGFGLKGTPAAASKLTAGVSYWDYRFQTSPLTPTGGQAAFKGNKHLGSEADLDLDWKHSENVGFAAGAGRFFPGGAVYQANAASAQGTNPAWAAWFDVNIQF